jgi:protein-tyrosine phosphatase
MESEIYWIRDIEPLRLALMPRPRGGEWLEDEISSWKRSGVGVVVSLLHRYEAEELLLLEEELQCVSNGIEYRSFPIRDRSTPESTSAFLALADELAVLVKQGSSVAVHCRAGIGRSALLAGFVLLRLGVAANDVFPVLSRARGLAVPDTSSQIEWFHFTSKHAITL